MSSRSLRRKRLFRPPASPGTSQKIRQIEEPPTGRRWPQSFPPPPIKPRKFPAETFIQKEGRMSPPLLFTLADTFFSPSIPPWNTPAPP